MSPDPALQDQLRSMLSKAHRSLKAATTHRAEADYDNQPAAEQVVAVATEMVDAVGRLLR